MDEADDESSSPIKAQASSGSFTFALKECEENLGEIETSGIPPAKPSYKNKSYP